MSLVDLLVTVPYFLCGLVCWRAMAGHVAWRIHTSAEQRSGLSPEPEDWVLAAVLTAVVALPFWWVVAAFHFAPDRFKAATEKEAEEMAAQIKYERLMLESKRREQQLDQRLELESGK